ncbi:MAG TPA: hypothetical protein PKA00_19310 [Saprospiraceae bacterium]|nr:hypothetical protein [Saprospiraceae bacterium]HMQ85067.1 hypothetical protein [Saprospiraceae bacterium]
MKSLTLFLLMACLGATASAHPIEPFMTPLSHSISAPTGVAKLIGKWENTTYPFDVSSSTTAEELSDAYLKYEFREDGRFSRYIGNQDKRLKEDGSWYFSMEGSNHVLIMELDNGTCVKALVKHLEWDELVLYHELKCEDPLMSAGTKDFYFNRQ